MKELKEVVLLGAKLREDSFTDDKWGYYALNIHEAVHEAVKKLNYKQDLLHPASCMLHCSWDEALDWANGVTK